MSTFFYFNKFNKLNKYKNYLDIYYNPALKNTQTNIKRHKYFLELEKELNEDLIIFGFCPYINQTFLEQKNNPTIQLYKRKNFNNGLYNYIKKKNINDISSKIHFIRNKYNTNFSFKIFKKQSNIKKYKNNSVILSNLKNKNNNSLPEKNKLRKKIYSSDNIYNSINNNFYIQKYKYKMNSIKEINELHHHFNLSKQKINKVTNENLNKKIKLNLDIDYKSNLINSSNSLNKLDKYNKINIINKLKISKIYHNKLINKIIEKFNDNKENKEENEDNEKIKNKINNHNNYENENNLIIQNLKKLNK